MEPGRWERLTGSRRATADEEAADPRPAAHSRELDARRGHGHVHPVAATGARDLRDDRLAVQPSDAGAAADCGERGRGRPRTPQASTPALGIGSWLVENAPTSEKDAIRGGRRYVGSARHPPTTPTVAVSQTAGRLDRCSRMAPTRCSCRA